MDPTEQEADTVYSTDPEADIVDSTGPEARVGRAAFDMACTKLAPHVKRDFSTLAKHFHDSHADPLIFTNMGDTKCAAIVSGGDMLKLSGAVGAVKICGMGISMTSICAAVDAVRSSGGVAVIFLWEGQVVVSVLNCKAPSD